MVPSSPQESCKVGNLVGAVSPMGSASTWEGGVGSQAQNFSF